MKALVILGGGLSKSKLNAKTLLRYKKALKVQHKFDIIICSAGITYRNTKRKTTEAQVGKEFLIQHGVEEHRILTEGRSKDTLSNAYYTRLFCEKQKIQSIGLVTSNLHMKRAKFCFTFVFPKKFPIKCFKAPYPKGDLQKKNRKLHEKYVLKFLKSHLSKTYKIEPGNMKQLKKFFTTTYLATSGKTDLHQKKLTEKLTSLLDKRSPLKY